MANLGVKLAAVIVVVLIAAGGIYYVLGDAQEDNTKGDRTITDVFGNEFTVPENVESVVAECGPALRYLSFMGEDISKKVIATSSVAAKPVLSGISYNYVYGLGDLDMVGDFTNSATMEKIVTLKPDLVIIGNQADTIKKEVAEFKEKMNAAGIPVCIIKYVYNLDDPDFEKQVNLMGEIFHKSDRAKELLAGIDNQMKTLDDLCSKINETSNVYIGGVLAYGNADLLRSITTGSSALAYLGTTVNNVAEDDGMGAPNGAQWISTKSEEALLQYDKNNGIDAIFIDLGGYKKVADGSKWISELSAYPEHTYVSLPTVAFSTCYDNTLIDAYWTLYALYSEKYPEVFKDIDMKDTATSIWSLFLDCSQEEADGIYSGIAQTYGVNDLFVPYEEAIA